MSSKNSRQWLSNICHNKRLVFKVPTIFPLITVIFATIQQSIIIVRAVLAKFHCLSDALNFLSSSLNFSLSPFRKIKDEREFLCSGAFGYIFTSHIPIPDYHWPFPSNPAWLVSIFGPVPFYDFHKPLPLVVWSETTCLKELDN